ncbi:hypothetical protein JK358_31365 [Nocardia sp. 2]|uniref:Uncharacterized protein n=1 Tax=Nocardia acididurans TaxID=2802282 RepID=A0ABS1ME63_9NOCA|nr:hypothetical protein [Nocardia acididurans]MBL1078912.1 hypothetical protein [Nocardia acididurans]
MLSRLKSGSRRTAVRVAAAGMLAVVPLAVVSVSAGAAPVAPSYDPPAYVAPDPGTDPAIMLLLNQTPPDVENMRKRSQHENQDCP